MTIKSELNKKKNKRPAINQNIEAQEVRLIGIDGQQIGIVKIAEALQKAEAEKLDLVEISSDVKPIVCKIMDYGKQVFEVKKQKTAARKKQKKIQVKEIKFRPGTDIGDYQVKLRNLMRFLQNGDKAKVTMRYRGREMVHQELGMQLLKRVEADLIDYGSIEQLPKLEGRQLTIMLAPKKRK